MPQESLKMVEKSLKWLKYPMDSDWEMIPCGRSEVRGQSPSIPMSARSLETKRKTENQTNNPQGCGIIPEFFRHSRRHFPMETNKRQSNSMIKPTRCRHLSLLIQPSQNP